MIEQHRYLRTSRKGKVSEATVIDYLRKHLSWMASLFTGLWIQKTN